MLPTELGDGPRGPKFVGKFVGAIHVHAARGSTVRQYDDPLLFKVPAAGNLNEADPLRP